MINVTKLYEQQLDSIVAIEHQAHSYPWSEQQLKECFEDKFGQNFALIVEGELIGYALWQQIFEQATLLNICILPSQQGKGYAARLLQASLDQLERLGAQQYFLEVRVSNIAAIKLYEKLGFHQTGCRKGYYKAEPQREDALLYQLG